jgi:hypothetical protein
MRGSPGAMCDWGRGIRPAKHAVRVEREEIELPAPPGKPEEPWRRPESLKSNPSSLCGKSDPGSSAKGEKIII